MKPILFNTEMVKAILEGRKTVTRRVVAEDIVSEERTRGITKRVSVCRYNVGDILYVRESWRELVRPIGTPKEFAYRADTDARVTGLFKWKPSIHMPKEAARLFLRVTDVRVERLLDISEEQAWKEGMVSECASCERYNSLECQDCDNEHEAFLNFMVLWDSTIKKDQLKKYGCEANPYVWVIEFEVIDKPVEE